MLCHIPECMYLNHTRDYCYMSCKKDVGVRTPNCRGHATNEILHYNSDPDIYFECCNKQLHIHKNIKPVKISTEKLPLLCAADFYR